MLIVTTSTLREIRAARLNPIRGRVQNSLQPPPRKSRLLLDKMSLYLLAVDRERHENSFAGPIFIAGQAREPVSSIYEFFNFELHHCDSNVRPGLSAGGSETAQSPQLE